MCSPIIAASDRGSDSVRGLPVLVGPSMRRPLTSAIASTTSMVPRSRFARSTLRAASSPYRIPVYAAV